MSDTPRMHSALMDAPEAGFANIWRVGCDIERELNGANQIIRQQQLLDEENLRLQDRIQRLEEAGDALYECLFSVAGENHPAKKSWRKAKEAKP